MAPKPDDVPSAPEPPDDPATHTALAAADDLVEARWRDCDLEGVDASHVRLTRCCFTRVRLTAAVLRAVRLVDVLFDDCELSGAGWVESEFTRVEFRNCRMIGADLSRAELRHVRFVECNLDDANLRMAKLDHVRADHTSMVGADAADADLRFVGLRNCDLIALDLSRVSAADVDLRGSTVENLRGAHALRGVTIGTDQVIPFAISVFADTGVRVSD